MSGAVKAPLPTRASRGTRKLQSRVDEGEGLLTVPHRLARGQRYNLQNIKLQASTVESGATRQARDHRSCTPFPNVRSFPHESKYHAYLASASK